MKLETQLTELREQQRKVEQQIALKRSRMKFKCGCGAMHAIKDCILIQTHWYTPPSGCTDGDYWNEGEMQVVCPTTDSKNRLFFDSEYKVDYFSRRDYAYSAEKQFRSIYSSLFKEVIRDYDEDKRDWWNNNYFDDNRKRFGLHVKGLDNE